MDELIQQLERDIEAAARVARARKTGSFVRLAGMRRVPGGEPRVEVGAALLARQGFVVGEVVGVAHEGVDGADGVALGFGQGEKGVVEIFRLAAGDGGAGS